MSFTRAVVEASAELMRRMGYVGLFVLMTLESALVPIPSEVVMPLAGFLAQRRAFDYTLVVVIASLANLAGSLVAYALGASLGRRFVERFGKYLLISSEHVRAAERLFERWGHWVVLAGRMLPAVRTVISLPAGVARMHLSKFVFFTFIGSLPWNAALAYLGFVLGERWEIIENFMPYIDAAAAAGLLLLALALLYRIRRASRSSCHFSSLLPRAPSP